MLTCPALYVLLHDTYGWPIGWALLGTLPASPPSAGCVDVLAHRLIPAPSLYGAESELRDQDVLTRRRLWYWRRKYRLLMWLARAVRGGRC